MLARHVQWNPDIREWSGPEDKSLIFGFGLFYLGNKGSNLGSEKISLISRLHCTKTQYGDNGLVEEGSLKLFSRK